MKARSVQIKGKELVGTAIERGDAELGLQQISELRAFQGTQYRAAPARSPKGERHFRRLINKCAGAGRRRSPYFLPENADRVGSIRKDRA
jgi:hypothetical protein